MMNDPRDEHRAILPPENGDKLAASNPVAPTNNLLGFEMVKPAEPVAHPVTSDLSGVFRALSEIGKQLQVLGNALSGEGNSFVQTSPALNVQSSPSADCPSVVELVNSFLLAKARAGKSDRYLRALRNSLGKFVQGRAHLAANAVCCADVEKWSQNAEWSPRTQRGYVSDVRTMFNFAIRRGLLRHNPAAGVELPVEEPCAVVIHTPAQVKTVLEFARRYDLNICRALAVRYFAGLRSAEVERLEEKFIRAGTLEVCAMASKTRRRRLVTIQPALAAWLRLGGAIPVRGNKSNVWRDFTAALNRAEGVEWSHNVTRHSFVSYHLAEFENAGKTALEAGHSEAMLFAHYRELVTREAAKEFWGIRPKRVKAGQPTS
jgi:integrase